MNMTSKNIRLLTRGARISVIFDIFGIASNVMEENYRENRDDRSIFSHSCEIVSPFLSYSQKVNYYTVKIVITFTSVIQDKFKAKNKRL